MMSTSNNSPNVAWMKQTDDGYGKARLGVMAELFVRYERMDGTDNTVFYFLFVVGLSLRLTAVMSSS
jgi:hypothetical protein